MSEVATEGAYTPAITRRSAFVRVTEGASPYLIDVGLAQDATWAYRLREPAPWSCTYTGDSVDRGYIFVIVPAMLEDVMASSPQTRWAYHVTDPERLVVPLPRPRVTLPLVRPNEALQQVAQWTRLPVDDLAALFGASRRSIYNWLDGKPISEDTASSIVHCREHLRTIAGTRDPFFLRAWLHEGDPSPFNLIQTKDWPTLQARILDDLRPIVPIDTFATPQGVHVYDDGYGDDILRRVGAALDGLVPSMQRATDAWTPRELTGLSSEESEDSAQ